MNRDKIYLDLYTQIGALIDPKTDDIANMANVAQLLADTLGHHWTGFYRVVKKELHLGPFAGPLACTRIAYGKGVCGKAWDTKYTQVVANVNKFEGHIACSASTQSEIVVPCIRNGKVFAVLDIDSDALDTFDDLDARYLEDIVSLL
ncbi:GAF domain-containing protein [Bacteroidia bacterium]|nr:GAF domain-containing protein [Bacteroidia bacterium]